MDLRLLVKHSKASTLKAKNSKSPQDEWENILSAVLLGALPGGDPAITEGLEAVAEVEAGTSITITIQKRIEGITVSHM